MMFCAPSIQLVFFRLNTLSLARLSFMSRPHKNTGTEKYSGIGAERFHRWMNENEIV